MSNNNLSTQRTGTIMFFAPELFLLDNNVNGFSTDVWALGITIFLMVHGYFPFNGATYNELKYNVIHHPPLYPDNINDTQHDFFDKILHKDPMKRATLRQLKGHSFLVYAKYKENEDIAIGTTNDATRNNTHDDTHDDTRNATNDAKLEDTADNNNSGSVNTTAYVNKDSVSSIASTIPHKSQCETKERENNTEIHFNLSIENNPENPLISIDPIINLELSNSNNALHNYKFLENDAKDSANQFGYSSYDPPYLASTPMAFDHRNSSVIGMVGQPTDEEISNAIFEIGDAVSDADKNMR